ncbi:hypothetical protein LZC95_50275 [Pendulispora brunnea]|uniref:Holin n=1 Tax=Pendulispora brunnea TaxID=2905690 RepID=A0ABZ2K7C9_9BACT
MNNSIDDALALAAQGQWILFSAVIIGAIVRLLKSDTPLPTVPARWRSWLALGLGAVAGVLDAVLGGTSWTQALIDGLAAALTAMAGHDLLVGGLRGGRELLDRRPPIPRRSGADLPIGDQS